MSRAISRKQNEAKYAITPPTAHSVMARPNDPEFLRTEDGVMKTPAPTVWLMMRAVVLRIVSSFPRAFFLGAPWDDFGERRGKLGSGEPSCPAISQLSARLYAHARTHLP